MSKPEREMIITYLNKEFLPIIEHISKQTKKDKDDVLNSLLALGLHALNEEVKLINEKQRKENTNGE